MGWLDRTLGASNAALAVAGGAMMLAMMLHVVIDAFSKWLFNYPIDGTLEIVSNWYMVGLTFLPLLYVQLRRAHIVAEIFTQRLSRRALAALEGVIGIAMFAYATVFVWRTGIEALRKTEELEYLQATTVFITIWPTRWFLPVGIALMGLAALVQAIRSLLGAASGNLPDAGDGEPHPIGGGRS